jgi:hypothetical protein
MYIPAHFKETNSERTSALIEGNSFGMLVTAPDGVPFVSHLPFIFDPKNRSWRPLADAGKQAMARVSELFGPLRSSYLLGDRATSKNPLRTANLSLESSANCRF